jgi:hypothetical protein
MYDLRRSSMSWWPLRRFAKLSRRTPSEELKRCALQLLAKVSTENPRPDEDGPTKAEVIRIGLKVPYGDEEQIYRQVGRALDRLPGNT